MWQWLKRLEEKARNFVTNNLKLTILIILVLIAVVTFASIETLHFTSDPSFCRRCHPLDKPGPLGEVATWGKSIHAKAGVKCLDCHGNPGIVGYMRAKMGGLYDVYGEFIKGPEHKMHVLMSTKDPKYAAQLVKNDICMFCHTDAMNQKIRSERIMSIGVSFRLVDSVKNPEFRKQRGLPDIIVEGVRPQTDVDPHHKQHYEKGLNCVECHARISHSGITGYRTSMQICFDCHAKKRAENLNPPANDNCTACHRKKDKILPKAPIIFGKGDKMVKFEHEIHVAMHGCKDCHTSIFPMKTDGPKISFADHAAGKLCFSCHNGKKAFAYTTCTNCHAKPPVPAAIVYKPAGAAPVTFSHEFHTQAFECKKCHTGIWPMKKGAKKMNMDALYDGKFCGVCHNEKVAFAATDCDKCHIEPKKK
jgi:c(7)-type cytochrome triheme protein